jgi:hypothetical protein
MQGSKGIAVGFVAGLVVAGGAVLLLRDEATAPPVTESSRIAELDAQIQRLERSVSRLTSVVSAAVPGAVKDASGVPVHPALSPADSVEEAKRQAAEVQALANADAMVVQALQTGQWTRAQQHEFDLVAAELSQEDHGRLRTQISKAINEDRLQIELP